MADLFRCDKCKRLGKLDEKKGRFIVQELGPDGNPHPSFYNRKLEVCGTCLEDLKESVQRTVNTTGLSFPEANAIVRESRE